MRIFEQLIHTAARNVLGLELAGPNLIRYVDTLDMMATEYAKTYQAVFSEHRLNKEGRQHIKDSALRQCQGFRGAWIYPCPGEALILTSDEGIHDERVRGDGALRVAVIHEISHMYVVGGSFLKRSEINESRKNLLGTRESPPYWTKEKYPFESWEDFIRPKYIPEPEMINEAITHMVTALIVYEIADMLDAPEKQIILNGFQQYDLFLGELAPNYTTLTQGVGEKFYERLQEKVTRQRYGYFLAKTLVKLFNQDICIRQGDENIQDDLIKGLIGIN